MGSVGIVTKILAVRSTYAYPCCSNCRRKVRLRENEEIRFWCSLCQKSYRKENVPYRYYVKLTVADDSGIAIVTVFGKTLRQFFGVTATEFCRYVSKCECKETLQDVNINQIIQLSMEKCFLGSIVRLVFQITTPNQSKLPMSPAVLQNVVQCQNKFRNNSRIPELVASCILKVKSEYSRTRNIFDILTGRIECLEDETSFFDGKSNATCNTSHYSDVTCEKSCNEQEVESPWVCVPYYLESEFVLSLTSINESGSDGCANHSLKCESSFNNKENLSTYTKGAKLKSLQQSLFYAPDSNVAQLCTSFKEEDADNSQSAGYASYCKNDAPKTQSLPDSFHSCATHTLRRSSTEEINETSLNVPNILYSSFDLDCIDDIFDSPSSEDLDAFLAEISLTYSSKLCDQPDACKAVQLTSEQQPVRSYYCGMKRRFTSSASHECAQTTDQRPEGILEPMCSTLGKKHFPDSTLGKKRDLFICGEKVDNFKDTCSPELFSPEHVHYSHEHLSSPPYPHRFEHTVSSHGKLRNKQCPGTPLTSNPNYCFNTSTPLPIFKTKTMSSCVLFPQGIQTVATPVISDSLVLSEQYSEAEHNDIIEKSKCYRNGTLPKHGGIDESHVKASSPLAWKTEVDETCTSPLLFSQ